MNVDLCISKVGSKQNLFKYVRKGHNWVSAEIVGGDTDETGGKTTETVPTVDEIRHYQNSRYIYRLP